MHTLQDYDYILPQSLIAQTPANPPESCKFLIYNTTSGSINDGIFSDIIQHITPGTLMVCNNSKVVKARIPVSKDVSGFDGEMFFLQEHDEHVFEALVRPGKKWKVGRTITLRPGISCEVVEITHDGRLLKSNMPIKDILEHHGNMPLPPYISYDKEKDAPYQPVFADTHKAGSVAAPTASLHFSEQLLEQLKDIGVTQTFTTLHVGLGTFKQVDTQDITQYNIHSERIDVTHAIFSQIAHTKLATKPVLAIGTTITRTLESLPFVRVLLEDRSMFDQETITYRDTLTKEIVSEDAKQYIDDLDIHTTTLSFASTIYLYPGKPIRVVDELITNFHLPKSSLLMLVAAMMGYDEMRQLYDHAIAQQYRFYSFGDAMRIR